MKLGPIALKIRLAETRFGNYIFGAAELAMALEYTLKKESAFVIPLSETTKSNNMDNGINQRITERFAIVVALDNGSSDRDKVGLAAYDDLDDVRAEIFSAILGWQIPGAESIISYAGGRIAGINRAYLWYQFEFDYETRIDDDDGIDTGVNDLDWFDSIYAQYVLSPSLGLDAIQGGAPGLPVSIVDPDMTQVIDFTTNPDVEGPFGKGFGIIFDTYKP